MKENTSKRVRIARHQNISSFHPSLGERGGQGEAINIGVTGHLTYETYVGYALPNTEDLQALSELTSELYEPKQPHRRSKS